MKYLLFDDAGRIRLRPFTFIRPACDIRIGILTIREKWDLLLGESPSTITENYLSAKYAPVTGDDNILINSRIVPSDELQREMADLKPGEKLIFGETLVAARIPGENLSGIKDNSKLNEIISGLSGNTVTAQSDIIEIVYPWDIFRFNGECLLRDFREITKGRQSQPVPPGNQVSGSFGIFIEEGARIAHSIINLNDGPVYIGKGAEIQEGCLIRGPLALCEGAGLKMGTKVYGPTTLGPHSKAGGELNNVVFFGFSNKAHDGFIGNAVIGEWCNLGADTNCSNLKNNYSFVKAYDYQTEKLIDTGLQFCGLIMGDHTRCGINTMFNTGTVTGISCNIYGAGFPPTYIPSFTWGGPGNYMEYEAVKAFEAASRMMERRHVLMSNDDRKILEHVFSITSRRRKY